MGSGNPIISLIGALMWVVVILVLAYWCSRYLGKRYGGGTSGKYLRVIDRVQVGADRYLLLVKLQEHTYLVGVSPAGVQLLSEPEDFFWEPEEEAQSQSGAAPGFQELLKAYGSLREKKKERNTKY